MKQILAFVIIVSVLMFSPSFVFAFAAEDSTASQETQDSTASQETQDSIASQETQDSEVQSEGNIKEPAAFQKNFQIFILVGAVVGAMVIVALMYKKKDEGRYL